MSSELRNPMTAWAIIQGRVCHTPEVKPFGDGKTLAKFSIAQEEFGKSEKRTNFWDVVCFGFAVRDAEKLSRGENVQVTGRLSVDTYTGKDGAEKKRVTITADTVRSMQWPDKGETAPAPELEPKVEDDIPF